jgi:IPT/TIG domain
MEIAVRRAREKAGAAALPDPTLSPDRPSAPEPPSGSVAPGRLDRWLIRSVALVAALVVAAAIALIVSESDSPPPPSPSATRSSAPHTPSRAARNGGAPRSTSTSTPTTIVPAAGGPPEISSMSPASGSAGQAIVVAGANFLSSSGQIVATFDGQVAPTSCPAQNTCDVTVPASMSPSAQVVITTPGGASNALTFTYV